MNSAKRNLIWGVLVLIFIVSIYLVIVLGFWFAYQGKVYPGISVAGISVAGKNEEQIKEFVAEKNKEYLLENEYIIINSKKIKTEDLSIKFDGKKTFDKATSYIYSPFQLGEKTNLSIVITFDESQLTSILDEIDKEKRTSVENPKVIIKDKELIVGSGIDGTRVIYGENVFRIKTAMGHLKSQFDIQTSIISPINTKADIEAIIPQVGETIKKGLVLKNGEDRINISNQELLSWVQLGAQSNCMVSCYYGSFGINEPQEMSFYSATKISNYLKGLANKIDSEPVNAELTIKDGKVIVFTLSKNGQTLNIEESTDLIINALENKDSLVILKIETERAEINANSIDNLGIKELIATGYSNFAGSPSNRRHNIRVGASKFDGLLIKPGETFSFTANLGEVDAENGYLPELVIKENTTTPEYGGGLCQVSTTAFRATLNAGLPIIARKAHSYPVIYYKPYGTDATIYIPNPDIKFKNDTGAHILIQTRISGNHLYFDFYGTKKNTSVKFAGNEDASGAVNIVEKVTPHTYAHGDRGPGSFKAIIYRFTYDSVGKLINTEDYFSNYDSPDKYPH